MRSKILILFIFFLSACSEPELGSYKWTYYIKNDLTLPIYLNQYNNNVIIEIDTLLQSQSIKSEDFARFRNYPYFLKGTDSVKIIFNNEKYITFNENSNGVDIPRSLYNTFEYIESPKYTLTYTFTQEDYDNALPM